MHGNTSKCFQAWCIVSPKFLSSDIRLLSCLLGYIFRSNNLGRASPLLSTQFSFSLFFFFGCIGQKEMLVRWRDSFHATKKWKEVKPCRKFAGLLLMLSFQELHVNTLKNRINVPVFLTDTFLVLSTMVGDHTTSQNSLFTWADFSPLVNSKKTTYTFQREMASSTGCF